MSHNKSKRRFGGVKIACLCLSLAPATAPTGVQAAPLPRPKYADPAVINAGCEKNIASVLVEVTREQLCVFASAKVVGLDVVRRQKDREAWLRKNLRVERVEGTNRVQVGFRNGSLGEQAAIINAAVDYSLTKGYLGRRRERLMRDAKGIKEVLDRLHHLEGATDRVAHIEADLKKVEEIIEKLPRLVEHAKAR